MEPLNILIALIAGLFAGIVALTIIEIASDAYKQRRARTRLDRLPKNRTLYPHQLSVESDSTTTAIPITYTGGSTTETPEEKRKRINREKMRAYRAKKRAQLAKKKK